MVVNATKRLARLQTGGDDDGSCESFVVELHAKFCLPGASGTEDDIASQEIALIEMTGDLMDDSSREMSPLLRAREIGREIE